MSSYLIDTYEVITLFQAFISSLGSLVEHDSHLLELTKNRYSVTHRIAQELETRLEISHSPYYVDMAYPLKESLITPDLLIHTREERESSPLFSLVVRETYLTQKELMALHYLKEGSNCILPLAMSLLPHKNYILIYRAEGSTIDYYHYYKGEDHTTLLKKRPIEEVHSSIRQLTFPLKTFQHKGGPLQ
ncbi:MAG: hypothetical protein ACOX0W_04560 [Sphaerochaetaceae bacterium]|jgi:hypothetical protein